MGKFTEAQQGYIQKTRKVARQSTLDEVRRRVVELKSRDCFGATYGECGEDVLAILDSMKEESE